MSDASQAPLRRANGHGHLRDIVYGAIDGSVTTFAIVAGVAGAGLSPFVILALGFANVLADGFSMAAGNYSGTKAELDDLNRLRRIEIRMSDTEAWIYGAIFAVLLGFVMFNLWFAATNTDVTTGMVFSIISYSWEFVEAALVLPVTLQGWSRLSEIIQRINRVEPAAPRPTLPAEG